MKENVIANKSFEFGIKIVMVCRKMTAEKGEFVLSRQLLKSGTSIGANVEEAAGGFSRKDFNAKFQIAYKEAKETKYWLRLLFATDYLDKPDFDSLLSDIEEILKILVSILKTSKSNI
jgi:four helix bundle protein